MKIAEHACYGLAQWMNDRRKSGSVGNRPSTFQRDHYQRWRDSGLRRQFNNHFSAADVIGKDCIDFGCGGGELSFYLAELGARSVLALEASEEQLKLAIQQLLERPHIKNVSIQQNSQLDKIDAQTDSADIILCFDVMEHIMAYEAIMREWRRVLRPGGRVLIWWIPWWHPYGAHIESLIPIPWVHVLFSERTILRTCARVYDSPSFKPRLWDLDENGRKKHNKWEQLDSLPTVNKLSVAGFEKLCHAIGFTIERREWHSFGGSRLSRMARPLLHVPILREGFMSCTIYELAN